MTDHQFRNSMFGGFNRQDVLDFLTSSAEKTNEELNRRQASFEALEKEHKDCLQRSEQLSEQLEQTGREREEFKHQAEQLTLELARVSAADQNKAAELETLRAQLTRAQVKYLRV